MNLHEYQAKELFRYYNIPIPKGVVVNSIEQVAEAVSSLACDKLVVKAQVHAGGRGKAGGVKIVTSEMLAKEVVASMLGKNLVTYQTSSKGQPINQILIEEALNITHELYLGAVVDRSSCKIVFMASSEGGVEIEKVAQEQPHKIIKSTIDLLVGAMPYQAREIGFKLGLNANQLKQFTNIFIALAKLFKDKDLSLLEINPLVITSDGNLLCLDGKINIDENALYRHKDLVAMRDVTQEDAREAYAASWDLNYVALEGDIGCMVNGAGLAMGTMDIIKLHGGNPANFLDVGGSATCERVSEAFKIILSDDKVKAVLVNIFGGIVRGDIIAQGIINAVRDVGVKVPVVVRLEGNNADTGLELLASSGLNIITAASLTDAALQVVQVAKKG